MNPHLRMILMSGIAVYCLVCLIVLEIENRAVAGGVLQQYHGEYADRGSLKWRFGPHPHSDQRWPVYTFIQTFGISVYPAAIIGMVVSGFFIARKQSQAVAVATLVVCTLVFFRFIFLGVFTAVVGGL